MDQTIAIWDKYWPQDVRDKVLGELAKKLDADGITRSTVTTARVMRPERLEITVTNIGRTSTVDHVEMAKLVGATGTQEK